MVIAGDFCGEEGEAEKNPLSAILPEDIASRCDIVEWSTQPSSYYSLSLTLEMVNLCEKLVAGDGYGAITVVAGSAAMEEMAYMFDLLWPKEEPVVFANLIVKDGKCTEVGLDNLRASAVAALSPQSSGKGVTVCSDLKIFAASEVVMFDPIAPKNTFRSPACGPLGTVDGGKVNYVREPVRPQFLARKPERPADVETVWATLGGDERIISSIASARGVEGVVIAGMGMGSVPPSWIPNIMNIIRSRIPVAVVSRCFMGETHESNDFEGCYNKLVEIGVMPGGALNPYRARIRMSLGIAAGLTDKGLSKYLLDLPLEDTPENYK